MTNILDRLEKLKAMANSNSPEEAAIAIRKMQQMMEDNNLTQKDLDRYQLGEVNIKSTQSVSQVKDWESAIMWIAAKAFGGSVLFTSGSSWLYYTDGSKRRNPDPFGTFTIVGFKSVLPLIEYAATFLLRAIVKGRRELNLRLPREMPRDVKTYELDGYCHGFIAAVKDKVKGLGVDPLIEEYVKDLTEGRDPKESQRRNGGEYGQRIGLKDGEALDLNRPMSAVGSTLALEHLKGA